jgi:carboxyl-terminal processing protease
VSSRLSQNSSRLRTNDLARKFFASVLGISLAFFLGFSLGKNSVDGTVDQAINEIVAVDPDGISLELLRQAAIEGALKASGDEWSNYFPESTMDLFRERLFNQYTGLGIWLRKSEVGSIEVASVMPKSPAEQSGIRVGDQLVAVNENSLEGVSLTSALAVIRGALGKSVDLTIDRKGKYQVVSVEKSVLPVENIEATEITEGVVLLGVANFNLGTSEQIRVQLRNLSHDKGIIIDLRDNPGGQIQEAVKTAELFLQDGVIVSYEKANSGQVVYRASNRNPDQSPLIVLINRDSSSAAEILAGALQDRNRAVLIGERTMGKGTVQEFITLNDGSKLELTVAKYRTPSGRIIDGVGIEPDLAANDDEIAKRALQVLSGLATLGSKNS